MAAGGSRELPNVCHSAGTGLEQPAICPAAVELPSFGAVLGSRLLPIYGAAKLQRGSPPGPGSLVASSVCKTLSGLISGIAAPLPFKSSPACPLAARERSGLSFGLSRE
jgi:hypothetical protein